MQFDESDLVQFLKVRPQRRARLGLGCLNEFELAAYADGLVAESARERIQAHLADCESCLDEVHFMVKARKISLPESIPGPLLSRAQQLADSKTRQAIRPVWRWGAVGAAVASVVVIAALSIHRQQPEPLSDHHAVPVTPLVPMPAEATQENSGQNSDLRILNSRPGDLRIPTVIFPRPDATLSRSAVEFRWEPIEGTLYYQVRLVTAEGEPVWEQKTEKTSVRLPQGVNLMSGHKYFVSFRSHLEEGKNLKSKAIPFIVIDQK
jgi:hypothetical protein